jgi:ribonuclease Y
MSILATIEVMDIALSAIALVIGAAIAFVLQKVIAKAKSQSLTQELQTKIDAAKREADNILKSAQLDAAGEIIKRKEKFTVEMNQMQSQVRDKERRLSKREDVLDRDTDQIRQREKQLKDTERELQRKNQNIDTRKTELAVVVYQQIKQLLNISSMNIEDA